MLLTKYSKKVGTTTWVRLTLTVLTWAFLLLSGSFLIAQDDGGDGGDDEGTTYGGIYIDPLGVIHRSGNDVGRVSQQQLQAALAAAQKNLASNVQAKSQKRYISLNRLEKALVENNGVLTEDMKYLAGLQRIENVFFFADTQDIVIAGPAEGWYQGPENMMVGMTSGKPVCELQDLVTALRAYAPNAEIPSAVGCSIDPTEEGNARMQQFLAGFGRQNAASPLVRERFVDGLRKSLGMQTVRVDGIPATTHAAAMMVAADYRMKRLGIGVDRVPSGVKLTTFISQADPRRASNNALYRWFFVPDYQSVMMTEDRTGLQLIGDGVKLVAEDEVVAADGQRIAQQGEVNSASRDFASSFTEAYPELVEKALVFGQLRNFVDMLVVAAHLKQEDFYGKANWSMDFLGDETKYTIENLSAPTQVEAIVGQAWRGRQFLAPIGGGVEIMAEMALTKENAKIEDEGQVTAAKDSVTINLPEGQWWWD